MSARLPWRRHLAGDFTAETQHLSIPQVGVLVRLRDQAWLRPRCSIPNDRDWIMRRLGITDPANHERDVVPVINDFWSEEGDELVCPGLRAERLHAEEVSDRGRRAALKRHHGGNVHPLKSLGNR